VHRSVEGICTEEVFIPPLYKCNVTTESYATFHFGHGRLSNAAFCDGHVETIEPLELAPAGDKLGGWMSNDLMDRD
jgi:prepilin-type processing-associated H-X9-DG protein